METLNWKHNNEQFAEGKCILKPGELACHLKNINLEQVKLIYIPCLMSVTCL